LPAIWRSGWGCDRTSNGATAHLGGIGDRLTIMSFGWYTPVEADVMQPAVLLLDESNRIIRESGTLTG
jgi:aspartate 1-decarboxylase